VTVENISNISGDNNSEPFTPSYRTPPHNIDAEQALLGAILVNNEAAQLVQDFLKPEHFYLPVHGKIYESVLALVTKGQIADPVRLKPYFESEESLADVGGAQYLARLAASAASIINARDYGRTLYDMAIRRSLIGIGEDIVNEAYDAEIDAEAEEQISRAEGQLYELAKNGEGEGKVKSFSEALNQAVRNIEKAYQDPSSLAGLTTGLDSLNAKIGGMHPSDLMILAGRPAMGKTALATNIAFNTAKRLMDDKAEGIAPEESKGGAVVFFSLEMSADQLAARILSDRANYHYDGADNIQSHDMRQGKVTQEQFEAIARASMEMQDLPLFIDDTPALTITSMRTRARRLQRQHDIAFIVVDYLQLLRGSSPKGSENRVQEISEITRGLKGLAKELDVPVLALSQLSRMVEQRENKRPMLSDLRESGSIEQDADMVMFVFREEYYKEKEMPSESDAEKYATWQAELANLYGKAELIIGKQRHGPVGTIQLAFDKSTTRFTDLASDDHLPEQF